MLKKKITYTDFNTGEQYTEEFRFNLTKAELTFMDLTTSGGLEMNLNRIVNAHDVPAMIKFFRELILKSYGEVSPDGKRFVKSEELSTAFEQTDAYSELFMELCTDADAAAAFIKGVVPSDLGKQVGEAANKTLSSPALMEAVN